MKKTSIIILILVCVWCFEVIGQYTQYKKYEYDWNKDAPETMPVNEMFSEEDAVILDEQNFMEASGTKDPFVKVYIEKKLRIKFLTQKGIDNFSKITIPESFDPLFDYKDIPLGNPKKRHRPRMFEIKIEYFAARIIKGNGQIETADVKDQLKPEIILFGSKIYNSHAYVFKTKNLQVGDELEIAYSFELPYHDNWYMYYSARVFFHGLMSKQKTSFVLKTNDKLKTKLLYHNKCKPDSVVKANKRTYYYFTYHNLPGCLNEVGARPHKELPYFVYDLNPSDDRFYYRSPNSLEDGILPYWLYMLKRRESYAFAIERRTDPITKDKQFRKVEKFISETTNGIPSDQPINKMIKIHHTIVDSFQYQNDYAYYAGIDTRLERLGDFTEKRTLRDISRYKLYARSFNQLKLPYSTVYFIDRRVADMGSSYISPIIDNEFAFMIFINENPLYMYPKKDRFGLYTNELPFYWESSPALYVQFHNLWSDKIAELRFVKTPASTENDNIRITSVQTTINIEKGSIDYNARISLSGQFSTMTRGLYKYDYVDSSISFVYRKKLWEIDDKTYLVDNSINDGQKHFPYKSDITANYRSINVIIQNTDGSYALSVENWFNHITSAVSDSIKRALSFYPDFRFKDNYKYYLKFDTAVVILNTDEFNINIDNNLGHLKTSIKQLQPNIYLLESDLIVDKETVVAENISDVTEIYHAISKLNNSDLLFRFED